MKCSKCLKEKQTCEFVPNEKRCKQCRTEYLRRWRAENPEKDQHLRKRRNPATDKKYRQSHPEIGRKAAISWRKKNPHKMQEYAKKKKATTYGLTVEQYDQLISEWDKKCAICRREVINPFLDHCHKTGIIRGFLCLHCNSMIGFANDSCEILKRGIAYLKQHSEEMDP